MPDCHSHPVLTEPHRRSSYFAPRAHLEHPTGRRPVEPQRPQLAPFCVKTPWAGWS